MRIGSKIFPQGARFSGLALPAGCGNDALPWPRSFRRGSSRWRRRSLTKERFARPEWIFERKHDGIRLLAFKLAKHFAELPKQNPKFQAHLDELAAKANEGSLTPDESEECDKYVEYMDFIAFMQLKAWSRADASAP